jgi:hypothetical protein
LSQLSGKEVLYPGIEARHIRYSPENAGGRLSKSPIRLMSFGPRGNVHMATDIAHKEDLKD